MNATGQENDSTPVRVPAFLATLCHAIGINHHKEFIDGFKRPIKLVDDGVVISDILS